MRGHRGCFFPRVRTVLTVDDSKVVRAVLALQLKPCGFKVIEAENGRDGLDAARRHKPDLILLDVRMPVMSGVEVLTALRQDPAFKTTPVIMLTAESRREDVVACVKLGISGFLVKPSNGDALKEQVARVLSDAAATTGTGESASSATETAAADGPSPDAELDSNTVLVVDDSERVLTQARAALETSLNVLTAASGADAIEQYRAARPGVVVIDLSMPGMDGFETLERLRALGRSGFVALAVRGDTDMHERARKAGYDAVVDKPFQAESLNAEVLAMLGAIGSPDKLLAGYVGEEDGCAVLSPPSPRSKIFTRVLPMLLQRLRGFAEDGYDKLVLDISEFGDATTDLKPVVQLLAQASSLGIRAAVCTPNARVLETLRQIAETQETPYAASREAAQQSLR